MKNFEVYEDKIKELKGEIALNKSNELVSCIGFYCRDCKFSNSGNSEYCPKNMFEWLYEEYKKPTNIKELLENCEVIEDE